MLSVTANAQITIPFNAFLAFSFISFILCKVKTSSLLTANFDFGFDFFFLHDHLRELGMFG